MSVLNEDTLQESIYALVGNCSTEAKEIGHVSPSKPVAGQVVHGQDLWSIVARGENCTKVRSEWDGPAWELGPFYEP